MQIVIKRIGAANRAVSVDYSTTDDTALAGSDYTPATGTLTGAAGDPSEKNLEILVTDDDAVEPSERFTISLANATGGLELAPNSTVSIAIADDDSPPPPSPPRHGGEGTTSLELVTLLALLGLLAPQSRQNQAARDVA